MEISEYVRQLLKQVEDLPISEAISLLQKKLKQSDKLVNPIDRGMVCLQVATYLFQLKNIDESIEYVKQGIAIIADQTTIFLLKVKCFKLAGELYKAKALYEESLAYFEKALAFAAEKKAPELFASCRSRQAAIFVIQGQYVKALTAYNDALNFSEDLPEIKAKIYYNKSTVLKNIGQYETAIKTLFEAIALFEQIEAKIPVAKCYSTIANIYNVLGQLEEALNYQQKALEMAQVLNNQPLTANILNNLGDVLCRLERYEEARLALESCIEIQSDLQSANLYASKHTLGIILIKLSDYGTGEKVLLEALILAKEQKVYISIAGIYNELARLYYLQTKYEMSKKYALQALTLSDEFDLVPIKVSCLEQLKDIHRGLEDYKAAFHYYEQYEALKYIIYSQKMAKTLQDTRIKYESEKKEQENRLLQVQLRLEQDAKDQIDFLMRELHHRVKNNLQVLSSILKLQASTLKDPTAKQLIKNNQHRVDAMNMIHRHLYQKELSTHIQLPNYIQELTENLLISYDFIEEEIDLKLQVEDIQLKVNTLIYLGLILNEMLSNAFKYAFKPDLDNQLSITFQAQEKHYYLAVKDNGPGMSRQVLEEAKLRKSFGVQMIQRLAKQLKGTLEVKNDNGTLWELFLEIE